jgi:small conductance mechanosensitive channel
MGKVEEINLRDTVIRTFQGQMVIIPNKDVFQIQLKTFPCSASVVFDLEVGVSYGDDLEKVKAVTLAAVKGIKGLSTEDEPTFFYKAFADSSINFHVRLWIESPEQLVYLNVGSEAIMRIKKAYDEKRYHDPFSNSYT